MVGGGWWGGGGEFGGDQDLEPLGGGGGGGWGSSIYKKLKTTQLNFSGGPRDSNQDFDLDGPIAFPTTLL